MPKSSDRDPSDETIRGALRSDRPKRKRRPAKRRAPRGKRPAPKPKDWEEVEEPVDEAPEEEAAPPAPEPEPAPSEPDPEMDELRQQLLEMREQMEGMAAQRDQIEGVAEKFQGIEDRMSGLLQLSELLSVQYNPFLEKEEPDIFEGKHSPGDLLPLQPRAREPPAESPGFRPEVVRPDRDVPEPAPVPVRPAPEEDHETASQDAPVSRAVRPAPAFPVQGTVHPVGRTREAYLALCWMERLMDTVPPGALHLFLDHYRRLGWVGLEDHTWLASLAHSVAAPEPISWEDIDLEPQAMARFHRQNLRFFERLFHRGFEEGDPASWEERFDAWFGGA